MNEQEISAIIETFPTELRAPSAIKPLTGGQSQVYLFHLTYDWGQAILKGPLQPREEAFYREAAPQLMSQGIDLPRLISWGTGAGMHWLVREEFPQMLPPNRWIADPSVMAYLYQLHALPLTTPISQPFIPKWQAILPEYQGNLPAQTLEWFTAFAERHTHIFTPRCVIAGDDNVENWGVRSDGSVVLFDWDCVGYGVPARDLAVLVPGLGWPTLFRQVASAYLGEDDDAAIDALTHDMMLAKVQGIAEYLNDAVVAEERRQGIRALLPSWIEMLWHADETYHRQRGEHL